MPPDDYRKMLEEAAERLSPKFIDYLERALDKKQLYACTKCGFKNQYPDVRAVATAFQIINDYGKGKPAQQKVAPVESQTKRRNLEDLSDEELLAFIQEDEEDGSKEG